MCAPVIKKRIVIDLSIHGSEAQALCVCDAIGARLGELVEETVTPLAHSEEIEVHWDIARQKWVPDPDTITD